MGLALAAASLSLLAVSPATAAPTPCADGGACAVGDTGPGGGTVFYASATTFPCGATLAQTCNYLEAAGSEWVDTASLFPWSPSDPGLNVAALDDTVNLSDAGNAIGAGLKASNLIVADYGQGTTYAAGAARAFVNTSGTPQNDWYLPTALELMQLCKYANSQAQGADSDACQPGTYRPGFSPANQNAVYWSSSEQNSGSAWFEYFDIGGIDVTSKAGGLGQNRVRPIRAGLGVASTIDDPAASSGAGSGTDAGALPNTGHSADVAGLWGAGAVTLVIAGTLILRTTRRRALARK